MFQWIIVGGGIHGVTCASFLRGRGVKPSQLAIVDPNSELLASWKRSTSAVGVEQLRSTHVHHLAQDPFSLIRFAKTPEGKQAGKLRGKYGHPDLALFNLHSERVVERLSLEQSHVRGEAFALEREEGAWRVSIRERAPLYSANVVLAMGCDDESPEGVPQSCYSDKRVQFGFEADSVSLEENQKLLIVGAGMSGVQLALKYSAMYPGQVVLLSKERPVASLFDSDPGWIGDKYLAGFRKLNSDVARRQAIRSARRPGSVPPRLLSEFRKGESENALEAGTGMLEGVESEDSKLLVSIRSPEVDRVIQRHFDRVILATGYSSDCPQRNWIHQLAEANELPLSSCGYPLPQTASHWGKGLHLSGALAEIEVGPVARNIVGARIAAASLSSFQAH